MDWNLFLGRFHPLIVHLPIALILVAALMEWLIRKERWQHLRSVVQYFWLWGAISGVLAAALGWLLAYDVGYPSSTLFLHRWSGIGLAILTSLTYWLGKPNTKLRRSWRSSLIIGSVILVAMAGHQGAKLTHGAHYLWQYAPPVIANLFITPPVNESPDLSTVDRDSVIIYSHLIQPILDAKCSRCHNADDARGNLQLHSAAAIAKASNESELIVSGAPKSSELFRRVILPISDPKYMPVDLKNALHYEEIRLLEWWIKNGASFDAPLLSVELPADVKAILQNRYQLSWKEQSFVEKYTANPVPGNQLDSLRVAGFRVQRIAADQNWLEVKSNAAVGGANLQDLLIAGEQISWLDLSDSGLTDSSLLIIAQLPNLSRLQLDHNAISDEGLRHLKELLHLESLNLVATQVSDTSIPLFQQWKNLKKLYLWQTQVTKEGVGVLKRGRPDMEVELEMELE